MKNTLTQTTATQNTHPNARQTPQCRIQIIPQTSGISPIDVEFINRCMQKICSELIKVLPSIKNKFTISAI